MARKDNTQTLKVHGLGKVTYQKIGSLTAAELNYEVNLKRPQPEGPAQSLYQQFNENGAAAPFSSNKNGATNGVDFYRVNYFTKIPENRQTYRVSGLLAVPKLKASRLPLLSWQHGTVLDPQDVPSNVIQRSPGRRPADKKDSVFGGSAETLLNVVRMAGNGYALAASDYIGNGQSPATQAYMVKGATQVTTANMIKASQAILRQLGKRSDSLFLHGWSQGGLNTQWLSEKLQKNGIGIKRQASASGPTDLPRQVSYWINDYAGNPPWLTACMPLIFGAYEKYYGIKNLMKKAFRPEYLDTARKIYNKKIDWADPDTIQSNIDYLKQGKGLFGLPTRPKDMLTGEFMDEFNSGRGEFHDHVIKNTALTVKYKGPTRFYGGGDDAIVPPSISLVPAVDYQKLLGSNLASGIDVGIGGTHRSTFLGSLFGSPTDPSINLLDWFNAA